MSDYDSGLPIRSESDGTDERVLVKIQDGADPGGANKTTEVSENLVHNRTHGEDPAGTKRQLKLSESGKANGDGDYDAVNNSEPNSTGMVAHDRTATPDETHQNKRPTATSGDNDKTALDVAISDSDGNHFSESNPLFVSFSENPGDEIVDYNTAASIAKDATSNHDYTVTGGKTFLLDEIWCSASGKMKVEVQFETAAASGVFNTKWVGFNSTANPNVRIPAEKIGKQVAGAKIRIIRTNRDNQAQDLYSTLVGIEK